MFEEYYKVSSNLPKYKTLIKAIYAAVSNGEIKRGDRLPSITTICNTLELSRDTVLSAFKELKTRGIISSVSGKGYYLESERIESKEKVFLLFDEFNSFKEDIYNGFMEAVHSKVEVDIFFHHFNGRSFSDLISQNAGRYGHYIVMPGSLSKLEDDLKKLPQNRTFMLDRKQKSLSNKYITIYHNFYNGTLEALQSGAALFSKYDSVELIYPGGKEPVERKRAILNFCESQELPVNVNDTFDSSKVEEGKVFFVHSDRNLVALIKVVQSKGLRLGDQVGVVSFNDTELKEVVAEGIA
jgi:DNA-binding transcriptional regulator YhcF (GntR family)